MKKLQQLRLLSLAALASFPLYAADEDKAVITVTGTREATPVAETSESVATTSAKEIAETAPTHPSEIMDRIPGVHVNVTGGEGHMTAIRQPLTTSPVYLYLEDGIPTRSPGFFNHNALYEVNVPQSAGIEVIKGPGTALYGSDAIGGVVNVLTRPAPMGAEAELRLESGDDGWSRVLLSAGRGDESTAYRGDINITHSDGWRDATEYDRNSATLRMDNVLASGATMKTVLSTASIEQQTAGSSALSEDDYLNNPTKNTTPISLRNVDALRLSSAYEKESADTLLSITPFVRSNSMELLPNWSLSYDPTIYETGHDSLGVLVKYRKDVAPLRTRIISGVDIDYSPGGRVENAISPEKINGIYTNYTLGELIYDYDVAFQGISPYVHSEFSPSEKLRVNAGLRYDMMSYDYSNNLSVLDTGKHRRPDDVEVDFDHLSPKLGASYQFSEQLNGYASYRHAFRVPSEGQLFRQGQAENTVDLKPVKADSVELGLRGLSASKGMSYQVAVYQMSKKDDIISYTYDDGSRETQNAGETEHKGVELGMKTRLTDKTSLALNYSVSEHTYVVWQPKSTVDYSGNGIAYAPKSIASMQLSYRPELLNGGRVELEMLSLGEYWMDDANSEKYAGHDLVNLRASYQLGKRYGLDARVMNVTDERYATRASYNAFRGAEYAPGAPRSLYVGFSAKM